MVLDTRWKKFKYSNASKLLAVLAAMFMVVVLVTNGMQLCRYGIAFGDVFVGEKATDFYDSSAFGNLFLRAVADVEEDLTMNEKIAAREKFIDDFYKAYKKAEADNRMTKEEIYAISYAYGEESDISYIYDEYGDTKDLLSGTLADGTAFYKGDDGYYYTKYMVFEDMSLATTDSGEYGANFGHDDDRVYDLAENYYVNNVNDGNDYINTGYDRFLNVRYYAVHEDGTVITNVEDTKAFVQSVKNGSGDFVMVEHGKEAVTSENLEDYKIYGCFSGEDKNYSLYIQIDPQFPAQDDFQMVYENYLYARDIDLNFVFINMAVSVILLILLAVVTCRLAGHKEDGFSMAKLDKMPADLHFVLMGAAVFCAGAGFFWMILTYVDMFLSNWSGRFSNFESMFYSSGWLIVVLCAIAMLVWLMILSFMTSLARASKCNYPVLSKLLIVRIVVLLYKVLRWIFKGIGKGFKGFGRMIASYAFEPKKLSKRSVPAVVLYTLFNFIMLGIIVLLFATEEVFGVFCAFLGIVALLGADGYLVYRAVKYMKWLDSIIEASEKGEPLPYNTAVLPQSLKILADSLEKTNAELQQAVIKAVKDERTKTELITNVSHDLKTPLTSVINYIDLLQKCDIHDEDAQKYMQVIAEKSNKLKRLIEDLIEASKVSTGNVTLNKTLLNLNELAAQAIVEETADFEKNNLQLIFEEAVDKHIVFADGTKIYRVFENLLSNARKYSAIGSRVYAKVYSDNRYGYFEIKNISKEQLNISAEELTERFVRGDQSRNQDGNGLGLSIAKELCRLNGGELIISIDGDLFKATVKLPKNQ